MFEPGRISLCARLASWLLPIHVLLVTSDLLPGFTTGFHQYHCLVMTKPTKENKPDLDPIKT